MVILGFVSFVFIELILQLKSMEENHRIELREQENAWVQWKNAREQEMAELEQKVGDNVVKPKISISHCCC